MQYWLLKSEPTTYGIEHLAQEPDQTDFWDGVRNYQARNLMRDQMQPGDLGIFYHSSCSPAGAAGVVRIVGAAQADPTATDAHSPYYDPRSSLDNPIWLGVKVKLVEVFPQILALAAMRTMPPLQDMLLLRRGMRLSIQPVETQAFWHIVQAAQGRLKPETASHES